MPYQTLAIESRPPLAIISLSRAGSGNRIDRRLLAELGEASTHLADDEDYRVGILTGSDDVFSLGWDRAVIAEIEASGVAAAESGLLGSTFQYLIDSRLVFIAAINGDALSAGLELALACDLRLASDAARLGLPDIGEGRIPMAGGTQRLPRLIGRGRAAEMILTGRTISAAEALSMGLLVATCDPENLLSSTLALASAIAARGPQAVRLAKEAVHQGMDMPLNQALRYETDLTVLLQTTSDRAEGVRAFMDKRNPRFKGS